MNAPAPVEAFIRRVLGSLNDGSFVRLVLSSPGRAESSPDTPGHDRSRASGTDAGPRIERVLGRLIELRGSPALSVTCREPTRDTTRNLPVPGVEGWLRQVLPRYRAALLETTVRDWQLSSPADRPPRLQSHAPRCPSPPARTHDLEGREALDASARDWLEALGLVDSSGRARPSRADKHRQVMHFAEILTHLLREGDWRDDNAPVEAVDMGAGRGYLTFAAWQLLRRQLGRAARVTGIEARGELVRESMAIVERLGLEGLSFRRGAISEVPLRRIDILMALHACNTATDDAILRGVRAGARLLLVAPCCHQQIRPQLGRPDPVAQVLRHGIMAERLAEWLTDALRILFLQWAGYRVKAIEFVATEHTPKNLLLAGRLASRPFSDPEAEREIRRLKEFFGIAEHALDPLLAAGPPSPSASATAGNSWGRPGPEAA